MKEKNLVRNHRGCSQHGIHKRFIVKHNQQVKMSFRARFALHWITHSVHLSIHFFGVRVNENIYQGI